MTSAIVSRRNSSYIIHLYRNICSHTHHHSRTILPPSSSSIQPFHAALKSHLNPITPPANIPLGYGARLSGLSYRYLCTSNVNLENPASKKPPEVNTGEEEKKSGDCDAKESYLVLFILLLAFLMPIMIGAVLIFDYDEEKKQRSQEIGNASTAVKLGLSVGKAAIGGPFNLINHDGKPVTDRDFLGKWTLVYFGFTHCPGICPDELQKLAAATDKIKEKSRIEVVPVFISVDPERDTVEQVCEYVKEFHPKLIGLTGNAGEIRKVARAYQVYCMKTKEEGSDYLVDHSIIMYLMGPDMQFVKIFGKHYDVDALTEGIIKEINQYKK